MSGGRHGGAAARELDRTDGLAAFRDRFQLPDGVIYLDGNSLGAAASDALDAVDRTARIDWAGGLIRSWQHWIDLPTRVGDGLAAGVLGAETGSTILTDQTSVNLYKLATAAVAARPNRSVIVTEETNFPSDRYVLEGIAAANNLELRIVAPGPAGLTPAALEAAIDETVALVALSHVDFKAGALAAMDGITSLVHRSGALVLWDLSHSAGVIPLALEACNVDLAIGCTYKYLNGGPGAPAFLYVRPDLCDELTSPIRGWFGHADMFGFDARYTPAPGIRRFQSGTPPILSLAAAEAGIAIVAEAGVAAIRDKSLRLTEFLIDSVERRLDGLGFDLASPRDPARRGGHVALRHAEGFRVSQALIDRHGVIPDFRAPDVIRLGPSPLYTSFVDVWDAIERMGEVVSTGSHLEYPPGRPAIT